MKLTELKNFFHNIDVLKDADFLSVDSIQSKQGTKNLTFIKNSRYFTLLSKRNNISSIITTPELAVKLLKDFHEYGCISSENPEKSFYMIHNYLALHTDFYGTHTVETQIAASAHIAPNVYIAPYNVQIGENTMIEPNVTILENVIIGNNVKIGAGTVIGEQGFQYYHDSNSLKHVCHIGKVIIEDSADIYCNCVIYRGLVNDTIIGQGSKINSLVNVGHGVHIGNRVLISAGSLLAGSSIIHDDAWIGLNGTVKQRLEIGENSYICMGAIVTKDVPAGEKVSGNFAISHAKQVRHTKQIVQEEI